MKKEQLDYLESIGITGPLIAKVEAAYNYYSKYLACQLDDVFVSEYVNKDGARMYENLWFFNSKFCYEAKLFMTEDDFDTDVIHNNIATFSIQKTEFNIVENIVNDNSRMVLTFCFRITPREGEMKASKENCKQLSRLLKKYIQPNYIAGI